MPPHCRFLKKKKSIDTRFGTKHLLTEFGVNPRKATEQVSTGYVAGLTMIVGTGTWCEDQLKNTEGSQKFITEGRQKFITEGSQINTENRTAAWTSISLRICGKP